MVFDGLEDLASRIDDPALDVTKDDILVLKNAGSLTPAGMPEAGYLPIPSQTRAGGGQGHGAHERLPHVGTAFGTIVLHITPEAAAGGPLGLVESGDRIRLSVKHRSLDLLVPEANWRGGGRHGRLRRSPAAGGTG